MSNKGKPRDQSIELYPSRTLTHFIDQEMRRSIKAILNDVEERLTYLASERRLVNMGLIDLAKDIFRRAEKRDHKVRFKAIEEFFEKNPMVFRDKLSRWQQHDVAVNEAKNPEHFIAVTKVIQLKSENRELKETITLLKKENKRLQSGPSSKNLREQADQCRKKDGGINYNKLGRVFHVSHHTAERWCKKAGIK